jgi:hypothetical protein
MSDQRTLDGLSIRSRTPFQALIWVTVFETLSLAVLLVNLAVGRDERIAQAFGPVHGMLYLAGIGLTWRSTSVTRVRVLSFIPVIGAILAFIALKPKAVPSAHDRHRSV